MFYKLLFINALTLIRIIGIFILVPVYNLMGGFYAAIVALICYFTDSLDGFLARQFKASTFFGALFDGVADKLFTIINFIVLYLITPYALIPVVFEILIIIVQYCKYRKNLNVRSNIIGKTKVWILAICVVLTFLAGDINNIPLLSSSIKEYLLNISPNKLFFMLLFPAIIMEALTLLSYLLEIFTPQKIPYLQEVKEIEIPNLEGKTKWESFKYIWLNPEFYQKHKNDSYLRKLNTLKKEKND